MATITVDFHTETECVDSDDFEVAEGMESDIIDRMEELECDDWEISEWDDDYPNPTEFTDLDEYAKIVDLIDEHGEAFRLRYEDIGDFDFDDSYNGCYHSAEDFAQEFYEECYGSDNPLFPYVDWECYASDLLMDFSSYEGSEGLHIFHD